MKMDVKIIQELVLQKTSKDQRNLDFLKLEQMLKTPRHADHDKFNQNT